MSALQHLLFSLLLLSATTLPFASPHLHPSPSPPQPNGIINQGNTCHFNALLQSLWNVKDGWMDGWMDEGMEGGVEGGVEKVVREDGSVELEEGTGYNKLSTILKRQFQKMDTTTTSTHTTELTTHLGIDPKVQMDVAEVYDFMINTLKSDPSLSSTLSSCTFVITDYIRSLTTTSSRTSDSNHNYITIQPSSSGLKRGIEEYQKAEVLKYPNQWRDTTGTLTDASKGESIKTWPLKLAVFRVNRFAMDNYGAVAKDEMEFSIPRFLDCGLGGWRLRSVVVHMGGYGQGHYYAYVYRGGGGENRKKGRIWRKMKEGWWCCNDEIVKKVRWRDIKGDIGKRGYLLFYERM